jgi:8-oxo-dGTP pyrophosphatase MutT (NUDIX family)
MREEPPVPGELLNHGEPTQPRPASTVLLTRAGARSLEVLLVRRNPAARFMGSAWVFPGGAVDADEGDGEDGHRRAAVRELREEAGVRLPDPGALVLLSRWITPTLYRMRFDTWFFLAELPPGEEVTVDGHECVDFAWLEPADALARRADGSMFMVLPTVVQLEALRDTSSPAAALAAARARPLQVVQPRVVSSGESARVVLDG